MLSLFGSLLDRLTLIAAVLLAGAFPSFATQYEQQVEASLNQAVEDLEPFQRIADRHHDGSLDALVQRHRSSNDPVFFEEGDAIESLVSRIDVLRESRGALTGGLFSDAQHMLRARHPDILSSTLKVFRPGFEYSTNALVFALVAGVVVWLVLVPPVRLVCRGLFGRSPGRPASRSGTG